MLDWPSKGDIIIAAVIIAVIATVVYGIADGDWAPLCHSILIICLLLFFYNLYSLAEDRLEKYLPLRPKLSGPPDGKIDVKVECTKYLMGNGPIYIELNGTKIGKTHRNRSAHTLLPPGLNQISAYRDRKEMIFEEIIAENGNSLVIWSDNAIPPKYHVSFLAEDEKFDEEKVMASYKKVRKLVDSFTYQAMPFGIAGLIGMIFAMKFYFGYL